MSKSLQVEPWRIAALWPDDWGQSPDMLEALYRWVDVTGTNASLRPFRINAPDFRRDVMTPLRHWQPHGVVMRSSNWPNLRRLRRLLPSAPFVSTLRAPPGLANSCVVTDLTDAFALAANHLRGRGAQSLALYYSGTRHAAAHYLAAFQTVAPGGFEWVYPDEDQPKGEARRVQGPEHRYELVYPKNQKAESRIQQWLHSLPKPSGVVTLETGAAGFLLSQCRAAGLRVPEDVQLVGADDTRISMVFEPHLTSLVLPRARIGEVAMATMLRYLRHESPPPPPVIEVAGSTLTVRGSTGLVRVGVQAVDTALRLIQTQAARGASATKMAKLSGVGRSTLYRQFVAATGESPAHHLRKMRLEDARRRLREGLDSVSDIAQACGFRSLQAFTRTFRHEIGLTPTAYRKKALGEGRP